jgi:hypothetical protein
MRDPFEIPLTTLADLAADIAPEVEKVLQTPQAAEFGAGEILPLAVRAIVVGRLACHLLTDHFP